MQTKCRRFEGKTALVTAATAGIGLEIARRLGQEGANVVVSSRKQRNVDETVAQLQREGLAVTGCVCHVGRSEQIRELVQVTYAQGESLDFAKRGTASVCKN